MPINFLLLLRGLPTVQLRTQFFRAENGQYLPGEGRPRGHRGLSILLDSEGRSTANFVGFGEKVCSTIPVETSQKFRTEPKCGRQPHQRPIRRNGETRFAASITNPAEGNMDGSHTKTCRGREIGDGKTGFLINTPNCLRLRRSIGGM